MKEKRILDVVTAAQAREILKQKSLIDLLQQELQAKKEIISALQDEIAQLKCKIKTST